MIQPESIGRYEIKRVLGRGAVGVVYLARDPLIERDVAVKTLRRDLSEQVTEEYRERFLREARAAGRLSHPTIVTVYDVGVDHEHDHAFIAMEYLEGQTLKELMAGGVRYDPERAAHLGATLADALDHAHRNGVVHRDVKPANIIITADGNVKVTDFGIARLDTSDLTVEGSLVGTPNYMSPEQVRGEPADTRSDLYSLGVILFELVTGQRPFAGKSLPELSVKITDEPVPDPESLRPDLPQSLSSVIMRCMAKDPAHRFQTCAELAQSLRAVDGAEQSRRLDARQPDPGLSTLDTRHEVPTPPPPDLLATHVRDADTILHRGGVSRWLSRWSATAAPALRTRWFRPLAFATVLLLATAAGLYIADHADLPPVPDASALSSDAAGGGAVSGAPEAQSTAAPSTPESTLVVSHKNRMSLAFISLWVDGTKAWSERMTAEKNLLKRFKRIPGVQINHSIPIPEGSHLIEVHISGKSKSVEARASIRGLFHAGETRHLKVILNPFTKKLRLEWID